MRNAYSLIPLPQKQVKLPSLNFSGKEMRIISNCSRCVFSLVIFAILFSLPAAGQSDSVAAHPFLHPGAIEVGTSGSILIIEDITNVSFTFRSGIMTGLRGHNLVGIEMELGYTHIRAEDQLTLQGYLTWQRNIPKSVLNWFFLAGGGLRVTYLGSFRYSTFPVGFNTGLRVMFNQMAALRMEYSFRRVLHDPVANFSEHRFWVGFSLFFRNR